MLLTHSRLWTNPPGRYSAPVSGIKVFQSFLTLCLANGWQPNKMLLSTSPLVFYFESSFLRRLPHMSRSQWADCSVFIRSHRGRCRHTWRRAAPYRVHFPRVSSVLNSRQGNASPEWAWCSFRCSSSFSACVRNPRSAAAGRWGCSSSQEASSLR